MADRIFAFIDGRLLLIDDEVPTIDRLPAHERPLPVGDLGVAVALADEPTLPGAALVDLRDFLASAPGALAAAAGRAAQLVEWELGHAFCGRCGSPTEPSETELARICPNCGATYYPRITPAVIMLVEHDGRALLARRAGWNRPFFSVLAGFVEPGETLEECVRREVLEEIGVDVDDVRYFGSQSWPFPSQLMIGFTARATGSPPMHCRRSQGPTRSRGGSSTTSWRGIHERTEALREDRRRPRGRDERSAIARIRREHVPVHRHDRVGAARRCERRGLELVQIADETLRLALGVASVDRQ